MKDILGFGGADGCLELNEAYSFKEYLPNSLAIGDDEGDNALVYFDGQQGFGLYSVSLSDIEEDEVKFIAPSLNAILNDGIGIQELILL